MRRRWWALVVIGMLLPAVQVVPGSATASAPVISAACDQNVKPGYFACFAERVVQPTRSGAAARAAVAPSGYSPSQLASAYGFGSAPSGAGRRIYVIGAYDDPHAASDLTVYRSRFGLPACTVANGCFQKLNQHGATSPMPGLDPGTSTSPPLGWETETSIDLDMVSAGCPACSITLIEANDPSINLLLAAREARQFGAQYVSMSWGGTDDPSDTSADASFLSRTGVFYSVATGDTAFGGGVYYPSTSPYVVAVGGTSLSQTPSGGRAWSETAWSGASSGCSSNEAQPGFQGSVTTSCAGRAVADVSAVADPQTGVAYYDTYDSGWRVAGGTSVAAPLVAGIAARADAATGSPAAYPYSHSDQYNDVTTGSNSTLCLSGVLCSSGPGWDGPTGIGTPRGIAAFQNPSTTGASRCTGNLINNPGFEVGPTGWSVAAARIHTNHRLAHTGNRFALLDGTGHTHVDRLARALVLPRGCVATLTYFLRVSSADRSRIAHDKLVLTVNGIALSARSNLARGPRYVKVTIHLNRFAGRTVNVKWVGRENASLATSFYLDDVRVTLSR